MPNKIYTFFNFVFIRKPTFHERRYRKEITNYTLIKCSEQLNCPINLQYYNNCSNVIELSDISE